MLSLGSGDGHFEKRAFFESLAGYSPKEKRKLRLHPYRKFSCQKFKRISEIEKGKPVYLICQSGLRSYIASRILEGNGYETYNFSGGFRFYDAVVNDRALIERAYACGMDY